MSATGTSLSDAPKAGLTLAEARTQLGQARGRQYWRTLEELAASNSFRQMVQREFPRQAAVADWDPVDRRDFLRLMGASLAFAGLTACTKQHPEKIVPYVTQPEEIVPGRPLNFATAMSVGGYAYGLLMESHEGRPTKAEGNPEHPASLGATDVFGQAAVLELYDPDRSQALINRGRSGSWDKFLAELELALARTAGGAGFRLLTPIVSSPTLAAQIEELLKTMPQAKWIQYEPVNRDHAHAGTELAFGEKVDAQHRLERADVILSLDADFLTTHPARLRYARDFAARRRAEGGAMNRLYVAESSVTLTGAAADHRLALTAAGVEAFARALAIKLGIAAAPADHVEVDAHWVDAVAADLQAHRGKAVVLAGDHLPPAVHALAAALNDAVGAVGQTVFYTEPVEPRAGGRLAALKELATEMAAGSVQALIILGGNPVYTAPADLGFAAALAKVPFRVHLGLYEDETGRACHWHIPEAHFLEAWSDARAADGTAGIVQPLVEPLYGGRSAHDLINVLAGAGLKTGYDTVREFWKARNLAADFEAFWRRSVHDGVIPGTALPAKTVALKAGLPAALPPAPAPLRANRFEINLRPDANVFDGRFANNAWLQEVPRPVTKLVWDNALLVSAQTFDALGFREDELRDGPVMEVVVAEGGAERTIRAPLWVVPGHPDHCATLHLGYGRTAGGRVANGVGANAYGAFTSASAWSFPAELRRTGEQVGLVITQEHQTMEGRHHFRSGSLAEFQHDPKFVEGYEHFKSDKHPENNPPSIYQPAIDLSQGTQWGMVINLSACTGCNACLIACQAENNIPVVGKDQVRRNREMHWIRIDQYFEGDARHARLHHQPLTCMQCENAPCESVCPVAATVHSNDGINQMVYNRCVGTRYCANNCPYKVRRFNFYKFADHETPSLKLQRNPDVTVRSRGVMEKCTFCTQRISQARIVAKREGREIRDGEAQSACQQVCPTRAISFGNINDPTSLVAKDRQSPLHYGVLRELNTRPRVTYLARVLNLNPALEAAAPAAPGHHGAHGES